MPSVAIRAAWGPLSTAAASAYCAIRRLSARPISARNARSGSSGPPGAVGGGEVLRREKP